MSTLDLKGAAEEDEMNTSTRVRCNRALKDPVSMQMGMGPVCRTLAARSDSGRLLEDQPVLNDVQPLREAGLVCRRLEDGRFATNVPQLVVSHSPTGFAWGYAGSGQADLALNVLHLLLPHKVRPRGFEVPLVTLHEGAVSQEAWGLHQDFKERFIAPLPEAGGHVPLEVINEWLAERLTREAA